MSLTSRPTNAGGVSLNKNSSSILGKNLAQNSGGRGGAEKKLILVSNYAVFGESAI